MGTQTLTAPSNGPLAPRRRPSLGYVPSSFLSLSDTGLQPGATRPAPGTPPPAPAAEPDRGNPGRRWSRSPSVRRPSPGIVPLGSAVPGGVGQCDDSSDHAADGAADHPTGYRMGRWARLAVTTTVLVVAALLTVSLLSGPAPRRMVDVTVGPGDTLWSIATAQAPDRDPRAVISEIEQLNGLDGDMLHVGVVLRVPAEEN